ncbi:MAG: hypothetical protein QM831_23315 [Kofleriaceae bacterium]
MKRLLLIVLAACHGKKAAPIVDDAPPTHVVIDAPAKDDWSALKDFTKVDPVRVIPLPTRTTVPRFDVGGPVIAGGVAVVASSQFGFIGVDYRDGKILWTKPSGEHVAPPIVRDGNFILVGECEQEPFLKPGQTLLGCVRTVSPTGGDLGFVSIHGSKVDDFAGEPGTQQLWNAGDRLVWKRGEKAVTFDPADGLAQMTDAAPVVDVKVKDDTWAVTQSEDGTIHAVNKKKEWHTDRHYTALVGAVYMPSQPPAVRVANAGRFAGVPELNIFDIDAAGSLAGQVAIPTPGIGLVGHAIDAVGNTALAVQLDRTLDHHFIVGYAANALLMWVYPLPRVQRADPVGLAVASDAVVVFHDGDTLTVLPELSAPATAPGAVRVPSENPTP